MADEDKSTKVKTTTTPDDDDALLVFAYHAVGALPFEAVRALAAKTYIELMKEEWPDKVAEIVSKHRGTLQ
jgi:hypothetical protein